MKFNPCIGECTETGSHCEGCDRTHAEIDEMRRMVKGLVALANKMEYENHEDYADAVARSILHKLQKEV